MGSYEKAEKAFRKPMLYPAELRGLNDADCVWRLAAYRAPSGGMCPAFYHIAGVAGQIPNCSPVGGSFSRPLRRAAQSGEYRRSLMACSSAITFASVIRVNRGTVCPS